MKKVVLALFSVLFLLSVVTLIVFISKCNKNSFIKKVGYHSSCVSKNVLSSSPILDKIPHAASVSFYEKPIKGDGECFYRSIARFIYQNEEMYNTVREDLYFFFKNLSNEGKNKYYSIDKLSVDKRKQKLLGTLHGDNGWGGIDECRLVVSKYHKGIFIRNIICNSSTNVYSFNVYLPEFETVLYLKKKNPSLQELLIALENDLRKNLFAEKEIQYFKLWKHSNDFIFLSCTGMIIGKNIEGFHYETFWP